MKLDALKITGAMLFLSLSAAASSIAGCPGGSAPEHTLCLVVCCLHNQILPVAQAIAALMFVYGGAKYAYSAEDPGGRKQAKSIAVNAIIGLLIVVLSQGIVNMATGMNVSCANEVCPGISGGLRSYGQSCTDQSECSSALCVRSAPGSPSFICGCTSNAQCPSGTPTCNTGTGRCS